MKFETKRVGPCGYLLTEFLPDGNEQQYAFTMHGDLIAWLDANIRHEPEEEEEE